MDAEWRSHLREQWDAVGHVCLPGLFTADEAAALRREVQVAAPREGGPNPLSTGPMEFRSNLFHSSPAIQSVLTDERTVAVLTAILGPDVWCRWDQAVCKRPGADWFPWHQDNGYTQLPDVHLQLWVALTPSRPDNGGLLVAPGRHVEELPHRWQGGHVVAPDIEDGVPVIAGPGDVIAFSSLLPHATGPNISGDERWAYVAEFLPVDAPDRSVPPPHFVVARDGRPCGRWTDLAVRWPTDDEDAARPRPPDPNHP